MSHDKHSSKVNLTWVLNLLNEVDGQGTLLGKLIPWPQQCWQEVLILHPHCLYHVERCKTGPLLATGHSVIILQWGKQKVVPSLNPKALFFLCLKQLGPWLRKSFTLPSKRLWLSGLKHVYFSYPFCSLNFLFALVQFDPVYLKWKSKMSLRFSFMLLSTQVNIMAHIHTKKDQMKAISFIWT